MNTQDPVHPATPNIVEVIDAQQARLNHQETVLTEMNNKLNNLINLMTSSVNSAPVPSPVPPVNQDYVLRNHLDPPKPKIGVPGKFDGNAKKAKAWLFSMESYLEYHNLLHSPEGVSIIVSLLVEDALLWYIERRNSHHDDANSLLSALERHTNPPENARHYRNALKNLRQGNGSVEKYVNQFRSLSLQIDNLSVTEKFERFLEGLNPEVQRQVLLQTDCNYDLAVKIAVNFATISYMTNWSHSKPTKMPPGTPMDLDQVDRLNNKFKPLTDAQRRYLSANQGCFYCRKANVAHRAADCPQKVRNINAIDPQEVAGIEIDGVEDDAYSLGSTASDRFVEANLGRGRTQTRSKEASIKPKYPDYSKNDLAEQDDWRLNPNIAQDLFDQWGTPTVDLFASKRNKLAPYYYRKPSDRPFADGCIGEDAFRASWNFKELAYCNPPWSMAERVIKKIKRDRVEKIILIVPFTNQTLRKMSLQPPIKLKSSNGGGKRWGESYAFLLTGKPKPEPVIHSVTPADSKFIFSGRLNSRHAVALVDSGCTSMIISTDYVQKWGLKTEPTEPCAFSFANKTSYRACEVVRAVFECEGYSRAMEFYVAPVKADLILGTPWFSSIVISNLDWNRRVVEFTDSMSGDSFTWRGITKNKLSKSKVIRQNFKDSQAILRNSEWVAVVDIAEIMDHDCLGIESLELMDTQGSPMYQFDAVNQPKKDARQLVDPDTLKVLLSRYDSVFAAPANLPPNRPDNHEIKLLADSKIPPWRPIPQLCQSELQALKEYLQVNLDREFIQHSKSPYGASVLFVKKKDGSLRLCVDYRGLNNITLKDRTPLPNIKEMQDRLNGARIFSKLDLRDGFNNILINPEDTHKTAFRTRYGHFEFKVLPFGLCNAPATFSRMMNRIFGDLFDECIITYVDDIVIYSKTPEEHLIHLEKVLKRLQEHTLFVKESKCSFGVDATEFCGTGISQYGICLDQGKLEPLFAHRQPKNVKDIQSFLGLCNWFRDFIPEFAETALPLSELTKKSTPWCWSEREQCTVMLLLFRIVNAPCLRYFDDSLETHLYTDASKFGIGGWIGQVHADGIHPVVFWSRKLTPQEVNYPTHERELLALVKMCAKYRHLLVGRKVVAHTDHAALVHLNSQPNLSQRQIRWVESLQDYTLAINYLPGESNQLADLLSRNRSFAPICGKCKHQVEFDSIDLCKHEDGEMPQNFLEEKLRIFFKQHKPSIAYKGNSLEKNWSFHNGLYYYGIKRLYIPNLDDLRISLLFDHHDIPTAGHQGFSRTLDSLKKNFYWETLREDTMKYVVSCDSCQRVKASNTSPAGLLQPLPIPEDRFETLCLDFMELPESVGFDAAMIMVDKLTKLITIVPTKKSCTAQEAARIFMDRWFCMGRGLPKEIISDRDSRFVSQFWKELMKELGVKLIMSTARHQQTNGQAEHAVKVVKDCLRAYANYRGRNWVHLLPSVEYALNNAVSSTTGYTPFQLAFGLEQDKVAKERSLGVMHELSQNLEWARIQIAGQQDRMEKMANKDRSIPKQVVIGDRVLIDRDGINWPADVRNSGKLLPRRLGPFKVLHIDTELGNVQVELPHSLKIHNQFARDVVSLYKEPNEFFTDRPIPVPFLEPYDPETEFEVEEILDHRVFRREKQFLVKWKDYSSEHNSWEPIKNVSADNLVKAYQLSRGVVALWSVQTAAKPHGPR